MLPTCTGRNRPPAREAHYIAWVELIELWLMELPGKFTESLTRLLQCGKHVDAGELSILRTRLRPDIQKAAFRCCESLFRGLS